MEQYEERVAAVFGGLEPGMASKAPLGQEAPSERDRERRSDRKDDQHVYVPPPKRSRSECDNQADHRGQRSREHSEHRVARERSRGQHRRRGEGGGRRSGRDVKPDYVKNPSKWTKYDLKDDGSQVLRGMSQDQVNRYAAFQFLDEIKKRKASTTLEQDSDPSNDGSTNSEVKVTFKRPSKNPSRQAKQATSIEDGSAMDVSQSSRVSGEGSLKIAEYVVGSKSAAQLQKERRQKKAKLICLHSEEESDTTSGAENNREGRATHATAVETERQEKAQSFKRKSAKSAATIYLSHLEEEDEEDT